MKRRAGRLSGKQKISVAAITTAVGVVLILAVALSSGSASPFYAAGQSAADNPEIIREMQNNSGGSQFTGNAQGDCAGVLGYAKSINVFRSQQITTNSESLQWIDGCASSLESQGLDG